MGIKRSYLLADSSYILMTQPFFIVLVDTVKK